MKLANATKLHSKSRDVGHPWSLGGERSQRLCLILGGEIFRNHCFLCVKGRSKNQFLFRGEKNPKHG